MVWPWEKIWHVTPLRTTGCSEPANCYSFSRSAYTFWWSFNVVYLITSTWLLRYVWISMGSVRVYFIFSEKSHVKTFFFTWCFQKATESTCSEWGCSSEVNMHIFSSSLLKMGILCISTGAELEKFWVKGGGCSKAVAFPYPAVDPPLHKHVSFMLFYSAWVDFRWKYYINFCLKCIYKPFTVL